MAQGMHEQGKRQSGMHQRGDMNAICPKSILRDVLIGFGVGLALMVTVTMATTAAARTNPSSGTGVLSK